MKYLENQIQTPIENPDLVADADKYSVVIMKDRRIYKNTLK